MTANNTNRPTRSMSAPYCGVEQGKHAGPAYQGLLRQGLPVVQDDEGCRCAAGLDFHAQQDCSGGPCCRKRGLGPGIGGGVVQAQHEADRPADSVALRCCFQACSSSRICSQGAILPTDKAAPRSQQRKARSGEGLSDHCSHCSFCPSPCRCVAQAHILHVSDQVGYCWYSATARPAALVRMDASDGSSSCR